MSKQCQVTGFACIDPASCGYGGECNFPCSAPPPSVVTAQAPVLDLTSFRDRNKVVVNTAVQAMAEYLEGLLVKVRSGEVTGFVMGVDEKESSYTITHGTMTRADVLWMVENMRNVVMKKD